MRALATDPAARGLLDDTGVLPATGADLVLTHDLLVEGVHFLPTDPPGDVAWKLVAVNLSDLAAKGVRPRGVLLGYGLGDSTWDAAFVDGFGAALTGMDVPLLGGDTVAHAGGPRVLSLTAMGDAPRGGAPSRSGARAGDELWVSGTIGDAGPGLRIAKGEIDGPVALLARYRRPIPRVELGRVLAGHVSAMMDVSDGLLIDAGRLAAASGLAAAIDLEAVPLSGDYRQVAGSDRAARLAAATAGDDYELLFTLPVAGQADAQDRARSSGVPITCIGRMIEGTGLHLHDAAGPVPLPARLGYEHGAG